MDAVPDVAINRRPVTIALFVGLVIAMAQIVPMSQLPMYFGVVLKFGPMFGIVGMAPLFVSLILAGPIAGYLLARFQPRHLVADRRRGDMQFGRREREAAAPRHGLESLQAGGRGQGRHGANPVVG